VPVKRYFIVAVWRGRSIFVEQAEFLIYLPYRAGDKKA
jgi:hypothetical protein